MSKLKNILTSSIFHLDTKKVTILSIVLIIAVSYGLFFYLQNNTENNIRNSLFQQQRERQVEFTQTLSRHIGSDLDLIMSKLELLASSDTLQQGNLVGNETTEVLEKIYHQINSITPLDRLFILDKNNVVASSIAAGDLPRYVGVDFSDREWVRETEDTLVPVFSNGFEGRDGIYRIAITFPILNENTGEYTGLVAASLPTVHFFEHYGNIYDIKSQYLAALDRNAIQLIHPVKSFIGTSFFGNHTQQITGHNEILNNIIRTVLSGKSYSDTYEFRNGERLNTGSPVLVGEKPAYFVFVITPTSSIYSQINDVISAQRMEIFSLLAGVTAAVVVLIVFLMKWNTNLNSEVKRRTRELDESNKQLSQANQQLKVHDKMQREFINIAAHELRTPIQPILGLSEVLRSKAKDEKQRIIADIISRNAKRLQGLAEDILDVTRIESHSLKLRKEEFNLNDIIVNCINDATITHRKNVKLLYEPKDVIVEGDKGRISQVVSNLLNNAFKFTTDGSISISIISEENEEDGKVIVSIKDTGTGIDLELFPRLFSKFATKSFAGTGLGLFIAKSIIEAHGGKIWAENNPDGKGATFRFSLPI
ncbi:MAG TPA: sensor histidine kinase [Nitrososphaeraceae archaeon]|nr:sensor histidine kinase [Nitrososphaeraceae archaeon]